MCNRLRSAQLFPVLGFLGVLAFAGPASPQVVSQSDLTPADADPEFRLTLEHLGQDLRWLGLAPRQVIWSPDGKSIYFRWREDPESAQHPDTDPWYVSDPGGRSVRQVSEEEVAQIPASNVRYSGDRRTAAWSSGGTLLLWTRDGGTRAVFSTARNLGTLSVAWDGSRVFFSTQGQRGFSEQITQESGDLWAYDVGTGTARQIAVATTKEIEPSDQEK